MAYYRCYFLSPANSYMAVEVLHSDTDANAIVQASVLVAKRPQGTGFDLWQRGRHVYKHLSSTRHRSADRAAAIEPLHPAIAFFARSAAGKARGDLLFTRVSGEPWGRAHQFRPLKDACAAAKISLGSAFTL